MVDQCEMLCSLKRYAGVLFTKGPNPKRKPDDEVVAFKLLIP
jgi:hypothetical protein